MKIRKKGLKEEKLHLHKPEAVAFQSRDSRLFRQGLSPHGTKRE